MKDKILKLFIVILASALMLITGTGVISANSSTVPKQLRGVWYQYCGNNRWYRIKLGVHAVKSYEVNKKGKRTSKIQKLTTTGKGYKKLNVKKYTKGDGYGGTNWELNKFNYHYQSWGSYWKSHRKIKGKNQSVLKMYYNMGWFSVYTKKKYTYDYSYSHNNNYMHHIGLK